MKRLFGIVLCVMMVCLACAGLVACTPTAEWESDATYHWHVDADGNITDKVEHDFEAVKTTGSATTVSGTDTYEIAVVTDVGQLMDGSFNQGTYEGAKTYAEANNKTYKYYQPANGSEATDNDRITAMRNAIAGGAKIIVAPGYLQAAAMTTVATENPDVKFIFLDGWALSKVDATCKVCGYEKTSALSNVTAIVYKEQEAGYFAGYAAVMEGYRKLGATLGGGGSNPACNRYGYGFVQGASDAAKKLNLTASDVSIKYSYQYGANFSASNALQTQIAGWYSTGTQVVFACGGSMFSSVKSAAEATTNGKIIGVDVDQASQSDRVITSAMKGLSASVQKILGEYYGGEWDTKLAGQASNLGAADDATGLPTATTSWRFTTFTVEDYNTLFASVKAGTITIDSTVPEDCNSATWLTSKGLNVTIDFE